MKNKDIETDIETNIESNLDYAEISHSWYDLWLKKEIDVSYRFSRPTTADIKRLQTAAVKNANNATTQLLMSTIHAGDKDRLKTDIETYPILASTLSGVIISSCGLANLGN